MLSWHLLYGLSTQRTSFGKPVRAVLPKLHREDRGEGQVPKRPKGLQTVVVVVAAADVVGPRLEMLLELKLRSHRR